MLKPLAALLAALTISVPVSARVESGTTELLQTLTEYGVTIEYNPSICNGRFHGRYNTLKVMSLCYTGSPSATDHNTVRHEAWHFIQHCAEINRGGSLITPLAQNGTKRQSWVNKVLNTNLISKIKHSYPEHHHQIELEAFAAAEHYTSNDLIKYIKTWCKK